MRIVASWTVLCLWLFCWFAAPLCAGAVSTSAASAILIEATTGQVLYEQNADVPRAMASTTKLMTALVAASYNDWDRMVEVTAEMVAVEGSSLGLHAGDRLTLRDTVCGMLLTSGNDAAGAVALSLTENLQEFSAQMNQKAKELGMTNTTFVTPSGLDAEGHAASARDMACLGAAVLQDPVLSAMCAAKNATIHISDRAVTVTNHNRLLSLYPDAVGLKTGFTKKSGRCLVSAATRDGVTLVAVTLNDGNDWKDHIALFDYGFSQIQRVEWPPLPTLTVPVAGGVTSQLPLLLEQPPPLICAKEETAELSVTVHCPRFLLAPINEGDEVGCAEYRCCGEVVCTVPIKAACTVESRSVAGRMARWLEYIGLLFRGLTR